MDSVKPPFRFLAEYIEHVIYLADRFVMKD